MLHGAMARAQASAIRSIYATDIGPVIDEEAKRRSEQHKARMRHEAHELLDLPLPPSLRAGHLRRAG